MNSNLIKVIKEHNIHPISYEKMGEYYIIREKERAYIVKFNTNNRDIYKYLVSRDFLYFPEDFSFKNDNYDLLEYIENIELNRYQRLNDLLELIAILHKKTSYNRIINLDDVDEVYKKINDSIIDTRKYYLNMNDLIDKERFFSPCEYLLVRNISLFYYLLDYSSNLLNNWYNSIKDSSNMRISLIHGNISIDNLIVNENKYLVNWDNSYFDIPIYDIVSFYQKYYYDLSLNKTLSIYENINKLNNSEKDLMLIILCIPKIINLGSDTLHDTEIVNKEICYLKSIYEYINNLNKKS